MTTKIYRQGSVEEECIKIYLTNSTDLYEISAGLNPFIIGTKKWMLNSSRLTNHYSILEQHTITIPAYNPDIHGYEDPETLKNQEKIIETQIQKTINKTIELMKKS